MQLGANEYHSPQYKPRSAELPKAEHKAAESGVRRRKHGLELCRDSIDSI